MNKMPLNVASSENRQQWLGKKKVRSITGCIIKTTDPSWFGAQVQPAHIKEEDDGPHAKKVKQKLKRDTETVENDRHKPEAIKAEAPKKTKATPPFHNY